MNGDYIILLPVLLPILAGILLLVCKPLQHRSYRNLYVIVVEGVTAMILFYVITLGNVSVRTFFMTEELFLYFKVDDMGRLFGSITIIMWLLSSLFSTEYMKHEQKEGRYYSFLLMALGVLLGLCFAGNLITMYIFYEFMALIALPLVLHSLTKEAISAGLKYLFYSIGGGLLGLLGFFYLSQYSNISEFRQGGSLILDKVAGHEGALLFVVFLMIIGFGSKAGSFPLHGWLPTAHPVAPAPASALLSGNITKMGVLAIIRVVFYTVGADFIRGTWVQYAWMGIAVITIFMGSMLAYKEQLLKKRLAYSTVSQVSYILFGLSLLNETGIIGALLHVTFHATIKNALFLISGAIIYKTGKAKVNQLVGIGKEMPITMLMFTVLSLSLVGIPPTSGFVSKWYLSIASLETHILVLSWLGPAILLISALLTAGYLISIVMKGFFAGNEEGATYQVVEANKTMLVPIAVLTLLAVVLGVAPNSLISFVSTIARNLL